MKRYSNLGKQLSEANNLIRRLADSGDLEAQAYMKKHKVASTALIAFANSITDEDIFKMLMSSEHYTEEEARELVKNRL